MDGEDEERCIAQTKVRDRREKFRLHYFTIFKRRGGVISSTDRTAVLL